MLALSTGELFPQGQDFQITLRSAEDYFENLRL